MKEKSKMLGVKICIPVVLVGLTFGLNYFSKTYASSSGDNPVVVSETAMEDEKIDDKPLQIVQKWESKNIRNLHELLGIIEDNKILVRMGLNKEEFFKKYREKNIQDMSVKEKNEAFNDIIGKTYKINLKTLEKTPLKNEGKDVVVRGMGAGVSPNGKKFDYRSGDKQYLCDLISGKTINYAKVMIGNWSRNGKYLIGIRDNFNNDISKLENKLYLYNVREGTTKKIVVNTDENNIRIVSNFYSEDGKEIYFEGEQYKNKKGDLKRDGVFKFNVQSGKIEKIMAFPYGKDKNYLENSMIGICSFIDGGKKLIFRGNVNGDRGIYIYDIKDRKFFKVVDCVKTKNHSYYSLRFWVSPDKSKIAYINKTEENVDSHKFNLYVAKINGHSLTNRIIVEKNINLDYRLQWFSDSKKIIFCTTNAKVQSNGFMLADENHINMVTFK